MTVEDPEQSVSTVTAGGTSITVVEEHNEEGSLGSVLFEAGDDAKTTYIDPQLLREALDEFERPGPKSSAYLHIVQDGGPVVLSTWKSDAKDAVCVMPIREDEADGE